MKIIMWAGSPKFLDEVTKTLRCAYGPNADVCAMINQIERNHRNIDTMVRHALGCGCHVIAFPHYMFINPSEDIFKRYGDKIEIIREQVTKVPTGKVYMFNSKSESPGYAEYNTVHRNWQKIKGIKNVTYLGPKMVVAYDTELIEGME